MSEIDNAHAAFADFFNDAIVAEYLVDHEEALHVDLWCNAMQSG